jgi:hypothetical protein
LGAVTDKLDTSWYTVLRASPTATKKAQRVVKTAIIACAKAVRPLQRTRESRQRQLAIAEAYERAMAVWRENFPQYIVDENEFYEQQRAERVAARQARRVFIQA